MKNEVSPCSIGVRIETIETTEHDLKQAEGMKTHRRGYGRVHPERFVYLRDTQRAKCPICGEISPHYGFGMINWEDKHRRKHAKRI